MNEVTELIFLQHFVLGTLYLGVQSARPNVSICDRQL